jgi:hypothetical protein
MLDELLLSRNVGNDRNYRNSESLYDSRLCLDMMTQVDEVVKEKIFVWKGPLSGTTCCYCWSQPLIYYKY